MKKKIIISSIIFLLIVILLVLPLIKIDTGSKLIYLSYSDDISEYESNMCYHESICYYEKKDISIKSFDIKKYFIFYLITLEYEKGNLCDTEWQLEEEYIDNFINNAEITDNPYNIDIKNLIEGKTAIVSNTRYLKNDYQTFINYKLDGKYDVMYVFYNDDLLILQVGYPDETTKFIAYKEMDILVKYNGVLYKKSNSIIDYAGGSNPIGKIEKLTNTTPKLNGETNNKEILNALVYEQSDKSLILLYNNEYVYFEKVNE